MKALSLIALSLINFAIPTSAFASLCTMGQSVTPNCFENRLVPNFRILLVGYGNDMKTADVQRIENLFKKRFETSTDSKIHLEVVDRVAIDLASRNRDLTELRHAIKGDDSRRTDARLTRLWYYYNADADQLIDEIQSELLNAGMRTTLDAVDAVMVLSAPQFEGMGFASGGYGLTEQPTEIAWGLYNGGSTEYNTDERLVDELLHEAGHILGLDHASKRCFSDTLPAAARAECCKTSPGQNDVMSYCRDRATVRGSEFFGYTSCTKEYLETVTLPTLLNGGQRPFQSQACN